MRMQRALAFFAVAASAAALPPSSLRADPAFESKRLDRTIVINGEAPEWAGAEAHYNEADGYKLGFFNDGEYLYVYFATWSLPTQRRILMQGLTMWFDGGGKKQKTFGINYPLGRRRPRPDDPSAATGGGAGETAREALREMPRETPRPGSSEDPVKLASLLNETRHEALIKSSAGDSLFLVPPNDSAASGIRVMLGARSRLLVIELRVPLDASASSPYAVHISPGKAISVGFETGAIERPKMSRPEGMPEGDRARGDMRPGGGMPHDGGMPSGGMGAPNALEGLKLWTKVKLAL